MNEAQKRGYKKVRITGDVGGWPLGSFAWYEGSGRAWNDDCTKAWHHNVGYNCEFVIEPSTLQVGETYTSNNGNKWECIAVKGDIAWLAGCFDGVADGTAYRFKTDGSPICLAIRGDKYRIKFPPTIKQQQYDVIVDGVAVAINYKTVDGVPDFTDATVVPF